MRRLSRQRSFADPRVSQIDSMVRKHLRERFARVMYTHQAKELGVSLTNSAISALALGIGVPAKVSTAAQFFQAAQDGAAMGRDLGSLRSTEEGTSRQ